MKSATTEQKKEPPLNEVSPRFQAGDRVGIGIVFLVVFVDLLGFGLVLPLLPVYAEHLMVGYSPTTQGVLLGFLMTSFSLMQFLFSPLWGSLSDKIGRRPILLVGLAGSTLCYTLFGLACAWSSLWLMFLARIGGGIMGATISTAQAYIADVTKAQYRASGMAVIGAAFGLGFTFGPLLGALAMSVAPGKQAALSTLPGFMGAGFSATALFIALLFLRESLPRLRYGIAQLSQEDVNRSHAEWHLLFNRKIWQELFAKSVLAALLLTGFLIVFALSGFEATLSVTLADLWQLNGNSATLHLSRQILWVFVLIGLIQTLTQGFLVRRLSLRLSEKTLANIGLWAALAGFLAISAAVQQPQIARFFPLIALNAEWAGRVVVIASGVVAAGMAFVIPAVQSLISRRVDADHQGRVFGIANSLSAIARIVGVLLAFQVRVFLPAGPFILAVLLLIVSMELIRRSAAQSLATPSSTLSVF
ncbi:MFS transporter [Thermogutta sp.]|uniref:MFS transporter n=1 Tax=Thermogutta sp. TaxID=1962930 RepID=UPI00321FE163